MALIQADSIRVQNLADGMATLVLDLPDKSVNVFNRQVLDQLETSLSRLAENKSIKLLAIRSAKPSGFVAGADLQELSKIQSSQDAQAFSQRGQQLFERLAALPFPSVAVIAGPCLGGGLEFALACDYRLVVNDPKTQLGLPEVELGLLPGWGGTQRLPRVVGLERSLQIILSGKRLNAREAVEWGLADGLLASADEPLPESFRNAGKKHRNGLPLLTWRQKLLESHGLGRWLLFRGTERILRRRVPDDMPAPWEALKAIRVGIQQGMPAGLAQEREAVSQLAASSACRNLIGLFFQREQAREIPQSLRQSAVEPIRQIGVVGAGTMGAGIAQLAALKGCQVVIREVNETALAAGVLRVVGLFNKVRERGLISPEEYQRKLNSVTGTTAWKGFAALDLIIEAVVEDKEIKKELFRELEKQAARSTLLASNTSSLKIASFQHGLKHAERVAGLHFFNPVHKMPLVEVIRGPDTNSATVAALVQWVVDLGKTPVVVKDSPGFVVNRVLMPYLNEAVGLVTEGMPVSRVDLAMRRFGMPVGPLELLDQIGLDVAAHVAEGMEPEFGARLAPHPSFRWLKEKGWLGEKSGLGFYQHKGRKKRPHEGAETAVREGVPDESKAWLKRLSPDDQMRQARERLVSLMVNEAAVCLSEGLVADAATIDLAMVLGTGWAPHRGGPLRYAQQRGYSEMLRTMDELVRRFGSRFEPCAELRRWAGQ